MKIETVYFTVKHPHDKHKDEDNDRDKVEDKEVSPDENTDCPIHCQTLPGRMHRELWNKKRGRSRFL